MALAASSLLDLGAVGQVFLFAIVTGAVIVSVFSFGLTSLDRYEMRRRAEAAAPAVSVASLIMAVLCFAVCVAAVLLGLWAVLAK